MTWMTVAKKEYLENVRNAWIVTVAVAFLALTLLTAWLTSFFAEGFGEANPDPADAYARFTTVITIIQNFGGFFLPILALMLGFATIAGERESGSLGLLTAQPLSRGEIIGGKWIGLYGVLATASVVGFGLGGLIVLMRLGSDFLGYQLLMVFLLETLAWGAAWISVTVLLSAFFSRRGTAVAGSIGVWFLFSSLVWSILTFAILGIAGGGIEAFTQPPEWFILTQVLNPNQVYEGLLLTTIEGYGGQFFLGALAERPDSFNAMTFSLAMAAWIALPLLGAYALFQKKDV